MVSNLPATVSMAALEADVAPEDCVTRVFTDDATFLVFRPSCSSAEILNGSGGQGSVDWKVAQLNEAIADPASAPEEFRVGTTAQGLLYVVWPEQVMTCTNECNRWDAIGVFVVIPAEISGTDEWYLGIQTGAHVMGLDHVEEAVQQLEVVP